MYKIATSAARSANNSLLHAYPKLPYSCGSQLHEHKQTLQAGIIVFLIIN